MESTAALFLFSQELCVLGVFSQLHLDSWPHPAAVVAVAAANSYFPAMQHLGSTAASDRPEAEALVPGVSGAIPA